MKFLHSVRLLAVWSLASEASAKPDRNHLHDFAIQAAQSPAGRALSSSRAFTLGLAAEDDEEDDYTCTKEKKCDIGCCGPIDKTTGKGVCGFGPDFCGDDCTHDCDRKSECDAGWGAEWSNRTTCPLKVCCSEAGFCGTTEDYCHGKVVSSPQCDRAQKSATKRTIGYYEGWNWQRDCGTMTPDQIPVGYYSHINFAFSLIDPDSFQLVPMDDKTGTLYADVSVLKDRQPDLEVWIAIGGWAMNDPGKYRKVFSDLAASKDAQDEFFESVVSFLARYSFDGVDLDWEYPVAEDRGGIEEDYKNFVTLVKRLRQRLNQLGKPVGLSLTLPASYWYLRGFDIIHLEPYVNFYNVMTYDIHGVWDGKIDELGPYAHAHTNLTEIEEGLNLLWRNNINPERVNLGLGFYGRSFTMKDPDCMEAGCEFSEGGNGGNCTGTPGVLSAAEITKIIDDGAKVTLDKEAAVEIVTWDQDQWVSWDNSKTLKMKVDYANERCLGGLMVWAIDLDDGTLIKSLTEAGVPSKETLPEPPLVIPCFGGWGKDEL
ncbi:glycoside hydrolase superfamily [Aspergillus lucknowensis]|uniref:chitinase n=1 Tax=Aspergillus lucknowensis TaxID=176173 RepID=A0ABR4LE27_9EURO